MLLSIRFIHDLDTFPGFFFSPEVLGHLQVYGYQISPLWLVFRNVYFQTLSFPSLYMAKEIPTKNAYFFFLNLNIFRSQ